MGTEEKNDNDYDGDGEKEATFVAEIADILQLVASLVGDLTV